MQESSIFTKVLHGEVPGEIIFEDDQSFVMLTIDPLTPGHMLVIPKKQIDALWDIDDPLYSHLFEVAKQMAIKLKAAYPYKRVGMAVEGFGVPHAHIHVFGLNEGLDPTFIRHAAEHYHDTTEELKTEADKLRAV